MKAALIAYASILMGLLIFDAVWLSLLTPLVYRKYLAHLLTISPVWWAVIVFYVLYAFGIYIFVVREALSRQHNLLTAFSYGAVFGIVAYGTYDLTNQATLIGWPVFLSFLDMAWGGFMTGIVAVISSWVVRKSS